MTIPGYLLLLTALLIFSTTAHADKRIRFQKGKSTATVTGSIANGGRVCYFASARERQLLTATVRSRSGKVVIFESGETQYNYKIDLTGDQSICVDNLSRATNYYLTVSIR